MCFASLLTGVVCVLWSEVFAELSAVTSLTTSKGQFTEICRTEGSTVQLLTTLHTSFLKLLHKQHILAYSLTRSLWLQIRVGRHKFIFF